MNRFIKEFYGYLTSHEGFYMDEFMTCDNEKNWIALKKLNEGIYAVVIASSKYEHYIEEYAHMYLIAKNTNYKLHMIVMSENDSNININSISSKVYIDNKNSHIIYCEEDCNVLANIALNITRNKKNRNKVNNKLVTIILIIINVFMFVISALIDKNIIDINALTLIYLGGRYGPLIDKGEVWRLITCNFLHGGLIHIVSNMYSLYAIGPQIEMLYGKVKYIVIYFICAICSSLLSYIISPYVLSVGASGAIFGLLGALLMFSVINRDKINKGIVANLFVVIIINLWIGKSLPNIDNLGHIGGLIAGVVLGWIFSIIGKSKNIN